MQISTKKWQDFLSCQRRTYSSMDRYLNMHVSNLHVRCEMPSSRRCVSRFIFYIFSFFRKDLFSSSGVNRLGGLPGPSAEDGGGCRAVSSGAPSRSAQAATLCPTVGTEERKHRDKAGSLNPPRRPHSAIYAMNRDSVGTRQLYLYLHPSAGHLVQHRSVCLPKRALLKWESTYNWKKEQRSIIRKIYPSDVKV